MTSLPVIRLKGVIAVAALFSLSASALYQTEPGKARLGVKGRLGYVVKQVGAMAEEGGVKIGDVITATSLGGQITDVDKFLQAVRTAPVGSAIQATVSRFNPTSNAFDELQLEFKTSSMPGGGGSRLGLIGETGFVITAIDPSVSQPEVRPNDLITLTSIGGQVTNVESFQQAIKAAHPGSMLQATLLRFDPAANGFAERQAVLPLFAYPTKPLKSSRVTTGSGCRGNDCTWCCETCLGTFPGQCALSACETGRSNCAERNGRCSFNFCV